VLDDGVILRSQACLVASRKVRKSADTAALADIVARIAGAVGQ
jgi:ATP phosphoribosyltransferase